MDNQEYIESIELDIKKLQSKLRSISVSSPVCNKCGSTNMADCGYMWRCMEDDCNWTGSKGSVSFKNIPR